MGKQQLNSSLKVGREILISVILIGIIVGIGGWWWYQGQREGDKSQGRIIFVDQRNTLPGDGLSWKTAFRDLESALRVAKPHDQIWIAKGVYVAPDKGFVIPDGVKLYGGFAGNEQSINQRNEKICTTLLTTASEGSVTLVGAPEVELDGITVSGTTELNGASAIKANQIIGSLIIKYEGVVNPPAIHAYINTVAEVTKIATIGDTGGSLNDRYFYLYDYMGPVKVYLSVTGIMPTASTGERLLIINLAANSDAATVASTIANALNMDVAFQAVAEGNEVTVTARQKGDLPDATQGTSGFTVTTETQGVSVAQTVNFQDGEAIVPIDDSVGTDVTVVAPWTVGAYHFGSWRSGGGERLTSFNKYNLVVTGNTTLVAAYGQIIYVSASTGNDANTGVGGWSNAVRTLQRALDILANRNTRNDEIWVRYGTYTPTKTIIPGDEGGRTFVLNNNVAVYGGFNGDETSRSERRFTTIDGRRQLLRETVLSGEGIYYHVVQAADNVVLDGFVIYGGYATGVYPHNNGGGLLSMAGSPTIRYCRFVYNRASRYGGAVYVFAGSPKFEETLFGTSVGLINGVPQTRNIALRKGGAVYCEKRTAPIFINCAFIGNCAGGTNVDGADSEGYLDKLSGEWVGYMPGWGGAVYNFGGAPVFRGCLFLSNHTATSGDGGAIFNDSTNVMNTIPSFMDCEFYDNRAVAFMLHPKLELRDGVLFGGDLLSVHHGFGGAVYNYNSSPVFTRCTFGSALYRGNTSTRDGGAIYNAAGSKAIYSQCTFQYNKALIRGGAVYNEGIETAGQFSFCTFRNNEAAFGGAVYNEGSGTLFTSCTFDANIVQYRQILKYESARLRIGGTTYKLVAGYSIYKIRDNSSLHDYFAGIETTAAQPNEEGSIGMLPDLPDNLGAFPTLQQGTAFPSITGEFGGLGAAVYNDDATPNFQACVFKNHTAERGAAVYCGRFLSSFIPGETDESEDGGSSCQIFFTNCTFTSNSAAEYGGALFIAKHYVATIEGCYFGDQTDVNARNLAGPSGTENDPTFRPTRDFWRFSPTGTWEALPSLYTGRRGGRLIYNPDNKQIYYIGGVNKDNQVVNTVLRLDLEHPENGWWPFGAGMNTARREFMAEYYNGYVYVFGGYNASGQVISSAERMNVATGVWSAIADLPTPLAEAGCTLVHTRKDDTDHIRIHLIGGFRSAILTNDDDINGVCRTYWLTNGPNGETAGTYTIELPWLRSGRTWAVASLTQERTTATIYAFGSSAGRIFYDGFGHTRVYSCVDNQDSNITGGWTWLTTRDLDDREERGAAGLGSGYLAYIGGNVGVASDVKMVQTLKLGTPSENDPTDRWIRRTDFPGIAWKEMACYSVVGSGNIYVAGGLGRDRNGGGGAIYNNGGSLVIKRSRFYYNHAGPLVPSIGDALGGAIASIGGRVEISDSSEFLGNEAICNDFYARARGGAIYASNTTLLKIIASSFKNNLTNSLYSQGGDNLPWSYVDGGTIYVQSSSSAEFEMNQSDISSGTINGDGGGNITGTGGAVYADVGIVRILASTITQCTASAVYLTNITNSSLIRDSIFTENSGTFGGALLINTGSINARNCTFIENVAAGLVAAGGAVYGNGEFVSCTFTGNAAGGMSAYGGASVGGTYRNCLFIDNTASGFLAYGGAVSGSQLVRCYLRNNQASTYGGACYGTTAEDSYILENSAGFGGGVFFGSYVNCVIWGNTATFGGGAGLEVSGTDDRLELIHCSFSQNTAYAGGGIAYFNEGIGNNVNLYIRNSILWGNTAELAVGDTFAAIHEILTDNSLCDVKYSCIRGRQNSDITEGEGNIGTLETHNPRFVSMVTGNLRLSEGSPCIDAGGTEDATGTDIDGRARTSIPDMGAYEFGGTVPEIQVLGNNVEIINGDMTPSVEDNTDYGYVDPKAHNQGEIQTDITIGSTTVTLSDSASSLANAYVGWYIRIVDSSNTVHVKKIVSYDEITKEAQVDSPWVTDIDAGTAYRLYIAREFTIKNIGIRDLVLTGNPPVTLTGDTDDFVVLKQPASPIGSGSEKVVLIGFYPQIAAKQIRQVTVSISSNDSDENPYRFLIQGDAGDPYPDIKVTGGNQNIEIICGWTGTSLLSGTDFGDVNWREGSVIRTFSITNVGNTVLELTGSPYVTLSGNIADFTVVTQPNKGTILPNESVSFEIKFDPTTVGTRSATVSIQSNDPDENPYTFRVSGKGIGPRIVVQGNGQDIINAYLYPTQANSPSQANYTDFGEAIAANNYTITRTFNIINTGSQELKLIAAPSIQILKVDNNWVPLEGQYSTDFTVITEPATRIPEGYSTTFSIRYTPKDWSTSLHRAVVRIENNDVTFTFRIQGRKSTSLNIPPVAVVGISINDMPAGSIPAVQTGDQVILTASASYDPDGNVVEYEWIPSGDNPDPVPGIDNETDQIVSTTIGAISPGIYRWTLRVTDDGINGTGVGALTNDKEVTLYVGDVLVLIVPSSVRENVGTVTGRVYRTGGTDTNILVTLTNSDPTRLTIPGSVSLPIDSQYTDFTITVIDNALQDGDASITITCSSVGYVGNSATILVQDNDRPIMTVTGNGIEIQNGDNTPTMADYTDFGVVYKSGESIVRYFFINNIGDANLTLGSVTISGTNAGDFSVRAQPASVVGPGGNTLLEVVFAPQGATLGERNATVSFTSNVPGNSPFTFAIRGTRGAAAEINVRYPVTGINIPNNDVTPSAEEGTDFGTLQVGETRTRTFVIQNIGNQGLALSGTPPVFVLGENSTDFVISGPSVTFIGGQSSTTFTVTFAPTDEGIRKATVVIPNSDLERDPYMFMVQGTASGNLNFRPEITVLGNGANIPNGSGSISVANGTNFGTVSVGSTVTQTFTIRNDGDPGSTLWITGVSISGNSGFSISQQPSSSSLAQGASTTFQVSYTAANTNPATATVTITNNDSDEGTFTFVVGANGASGGGSSGGGSTGGSSGSAGGCGFVPMAPLSGFIPILILILTVASMRYWMNVRKVCP